jgi:hypothetical protein
MMPANICKDPYYQYKSLDIISLLVTQWDFIICNDFRMETSRAGFFYSDLLPKPLQCSTTNPPRPPPCVGVPVKFNPFINDGLHPMAKHKGQDQGAQIPRNAAYWQYVKFRGTQRNADIDLCVLPSALFDRAS